MTVVFTIDDAVLDQFPQARLTYLIARGLRNDTSWPEASAALEAVETHRRAGSWTPHDETGPRVGSWHDAYRRFGTNPRRLRPSVDALGRRLAKTGALPRISGAVDAYNAVSVWHGLPAGAFDLDAIGGDVTIRPAKAQDRFTPLGEPDVIEEPKPGEVVYATGSTVLTRHWNHRDSDLTKVGVDSRTAIFMLERVSAEAVPDSELAAAAQQLRALIEPHAESVSEFSLHNGHPSEHIAD